MTSTADDSSPFSPATQEELRQFLRENFAGPRLAISPVGGGTSLELGFPLSKPVRTVSMGGLDRVVEFAARDMTVTVEAGIRIERLRAVLAEENLRLPIDVPRPERATLGGAVAANVSGPRRFGHGTFRDSVIGLAALTAEGREFHSGGRVVKNVAGYDLCKLLVGSLGTLAVLSQITLKLKPMPESSLFVHSRFSTRSELETVLAAVIHSDTRPVAVETLNAAAAAEVDRTAACSLAGDAWSLLVGFEGTRREVAWQADQLTGELRSNRAREIAVVADAAADRLWTALVEFSAVDGSRTFQANLLPSQLPRFDEEAARQEVSLLGHAAGGVVIGRLPQDLDASSAGRLMSELSALAKASGGSVSVLRGPSSAWGGFPSLTPPESSLGLMRRIKQALDPADLLNPGRMFSTGNPA